VPVATALSSAFWFFHTKNPAALMATSNKAEPIRTLLKDDPERDETGRLEEAPVPDFAATGIAGGIGS
jgi:hypothetical protein